MREADLLHTSFIATIALKLKQAMENLRWRGITKVRMYIAICYTCILTVTVAAHKIGMPKLANSITTFTY